MSRRAGVPRPPPGIRLTESPLRQGPFLIGLALVTGATLALEVLDTRLLSVVTWYSLAFLVIAMGLFGLTAGAVRVYLHVEEFSGPRLAPALSRAAFWFALAVPASYVLLLVIPLTTAPVATTIVLFLIFAAALALPFYPAGIVVAAAVTRSPFPVGRVYAVDLIGAALGAPLVALLLRSLDAGTAILGLGVLGALASIAFARAGDDRPAARRGAAALAGLLILCVANGSTRSGLVPLWCKGRTDILGIVEQESWNTHSRIQVTGEFPQPAMFWGLGAKCTVPQVLQRIIQIDGHAATPLYRTDGTFEDLRFLECDVSNAVNLLRPAGPLAVIGVGGSRDIQAALLAGHTPVVGIELNDRILEILRGPMGEPTGITHHPGVQLVHDDARSWFARSTSRFQVIQASLIDTWAATGAGAHALGENGLYTLEAWKMFLAHLEPGGIFTVTRWNTAESARMVVMAATALLESGVVEPERHLAMLTAGTVSTLLVSRDPLTPADEARLDQIADERGFLVAFRPGQPPGAGGMADVLAARSRAEIDQIALLPLVDLRPATDDRPFFFNMLRLASFWSRTPEIAEGTLEGNLLATRTLGLAFLSSLVLVLGAIVFPLYQRAEPKDRLSPALGAGIAYFFAIGVGFMLAEIALLQRLSLILGHPIYSLIVVLAGLIASAGAGSLISDRLPLFRPPWCYVYPIAIAVLLGVAAFAWPEFAGRIAPAPLGTRIAAAAAVTAMLGFFMGWAFPAGMRMVRDASEEETPWFWGMNGIGSVLASSVAILIAHEAGLRALTLVAAACYALLLPIIARLVSRPPGSGTVPQRPRD